MFSVVCGYYSVCPQGGPHVTIAHDALDLKVQGPLAAPLPDIRPRDQHWRPVQTAHLRTPQEWHLVLATEAHAVCKQAVHILLECFPIIFSILIQRFAVNNVVIRPLREHEKKTGKRKQENSHVTKIMWVFLGSNLINKKFIFLSEE